MFSFPRALLLSSLLGIAQAQTAAEGCQVEHDQDDTSDAMILLQLARPESSEPAPQTEHQTESSHSNPSPSTEPAPCPYDFTPPKCSDAEVQSPRDLTPYAQGRMRPKAATLTEAQAEHLPFTNVHYHLGAEHKSLAYGNGTDSEAWEASTDPEGPRPGFMCSTNSVPARHLKPYTFKYCKGIVEVGKSYEIHYVYSSAGISKKDLADNPVPGAVSDGLGGAANGRGQLNPMIVVKGQVVMITNGGQDDIQLKPNDWNPSRKSSWSPVMYPGSTTGTSFNNSICSPYAVTWRVDLRCYKITAASFDNFCKELRDDYGLDHDLEPHGSRMLVDEAFVAPRSNVERLY